VGEKVDCMRGSKAVLQCIRGNKFWVFTWSMAVYLKARLYIWKKFWLYMWKHDCIRGSKAVYVEARLYTWKQILAVYVKANCILEATLPD